MGHFSGSRRGLLTVGGSDTRVLYDAFGNPNYMVAIPRFNLDTIDPAWPATPHPAFLVNGVVKDRIYVGKYQASLLGSRYVSVPGKIPAVDVNFDQALSRCAEKGPGWHLMTNAEWAAVALWCWKRNLQPRGNTNWGLSSDNAAEGGIRGDGLDNGTASGDGKTLTGSGPGTWNHNAKSDGIADLCGNVWEWVGGIRVNAGEINVLADNNAADNTKDQAAGSAEWKAILAADGSLVAPGTAATCKYDGTAANGTGNTQLDDTIDYQSDGNGYSGGGFASMATDITVPSVLKQLCLYPIAASGLGSDYCWVRNQGERLPHRGGDWHDGSHAGVFLLYLYYGRSITYWTFGFRPAFVI